MGYFDRVTVSLQQSRSGSDKGRTIRKLIGGLAKYKKIFAQGKIKWRQLILKNIHGMAWKNSYKEFDSLRADEIKLRV